MHRKLVMKDKIAEIIEKEYLIMLNSIKSDFKKNFCKKDYNFLLHGLKLDTKIALTFASSFESKLGNAMQKISLEIARLKYGEENVPSIINIHKIKHNIEEQKGKQIIVTDVDTNNKILNGKIDNIITKNEGNLRCKPSKNCSLNSAELKTLLVKLPKTKNIMKNDVDLAFYDGKIWNLLEIKAGGDLDSSNARGNIRKLLKSYVALNSNNTKIYFATYYHKTGSGKWKGSMKKFLQYPDMFLIGQDFWEKILPENISFDEFKKIYLKVMKKIKIENIIEDLKNICEE